MAAPLLIQDDNISFVSASTASITLLGVTPGNMLVGIINQSSVNRSWTFSDDNGDTWNPIVNTATDDESNWIANAEGVDGGDTEITATISVSTGSGELVCAETEPATYDTSGTFDDGGTTNSHFCAASTAIDTAANVICFASGAGLSGTMGASGATTAGTNWTEIYGTDGNASPRIVQYRRSDTALTDERGAWSHTGTARQTRGCIASFAGPAPPAGTQQQLMLLGVGV